MRSRLQILAASTAAVGLAFLSSCLGTAAEEVAGFTPVPTDPDGFFMVESAAANLAEIQASQVVVQKSTNPTVVQFANQMIQDHTNAQTQLTALADSRGVILPTVPDELHRTFVEFLQGLTEPILDQQYMSAMVADHARLLSRNEDEARLGLNLDVRIFAADQIPILTQHFETAIPINQSLGGGPGPCATPPTTGT